MIIYPAVQLQNGHCVTLRRGRIEEPEIWHVDPVETAHGFAAAGAQWLSVTDLDAVAGTGNNDDLIRKIIRTCGAPVQLGGGVRSAERAETLIDAGAGRVVLGTAAVRQPELAQRLAKYHPDQIVISLDIWQGSVMVEGWREPSAIRAEDFIATLDGLPLAAIIISDIDHEIGHAEASLALTTRLAGLTRTPVISRGMAVSIDALSQLKYVYNVAGAIIDRPLYDRSFTLAQALEIARPDTTPIAEFQ